MLEILADRQIAVMIWKCALAGVALPASGCTCYRQSQSGTTARSESQVGLEMSDKHVPKKRNSLTRRANAVYKLGEGRWRVELSILSSYFTRVTDVPSRLRLRSSTFDQLIVPSCNLATVGRWAFTVSAANLWNSLPAHLTSVPSLTIFRQRVKTSLPALLS